MYVPVITRHKNHQVYTYSHNRHCYYSQRQNILVLLWFPSDCAIAAAGDRPECESESARFVPNLQSNSHVAWCTGSRGISDYEMLECVAMTAMNE